MKEKLKTLKYEGDTFRVGAKAYDYSTKLVLDDYDWMVYTLTLSIPTREYGDMEVEFKYFGVVKSEMKVRTEERVHKFEFDSDIFGEYITKYLQKHIEHWNGTKAFDGIKEAMDFYNAVIEDPKTVEIVNRKRRRKKK